MQLNFSIKYYLIFNTYDETRAKSYKIFLMLEKSKIEGSSKPKIRN